ncbi:MAG: hypothetical protein AAF685_16080 [Cyanobacteria bacterium P01_C01_bin.89]
MTTQISATPTPYLTRTNRSFFSQGWVKVGLALTLIGVQPLIAQSFRTNSPSNAPSSAPSSTPSSASSSASESLPAFKIAQADSATELTAQDATQTQRSVIPPDRGAPDHTVGSGSR